MFLFKNKRDVMSDKRDVMHDYRIKILSDTVHTQSASVKMAARQARMLQAALKQKEEDFARQEATLQEVREELAYKTAALQYSASLISALRKKLSKTQCERNAFATSLGLCEYAGLLPCEPSVACEKRKRNRQVVASERRRRRNQHQAMTCSEPEPKLELELFIS